MNELCIRCVIPTPYHPNIPITIRRYYVEGSGQLCEKCFYELFPVPGALRIQEILGLSYTSVQGYLPHSKLVYSLDTMSAECERIRRFRARQKAVEELNVHIGLPD